MNKKLIAITMAGAVAGLEAHAADACTSMIFKAEDGTRIYARTMESGASDLKSEMMLAPRSMAFSSAWVTARRARHGKTNMVSSASTPAASPMRPTA